MSSAARKAFSFFIIFILISTQYAVVYAQASENGANGTGTDNGTSASENETTAVENETDNSAVADVLADASAEEESESVSKPVSFKCENISLTEEEVQNIKDLIGDGYIADEIGPPKDETDKTKENEDAGEPATGEDGTETEGEPTGEESEGNPAAPPTASESPEFEQVSNTKVALGGSEPGDQAIIRELPGTKMSLDHIPYLNGKDIQGPFSIGIVLEDTLRVGVCNDTKGNNVQCALDANGLMLRNSGEGIKSNFVNVWEDFKQINIIGGAGVGLSNISAGMAEKFAGIKDMLTGKKDAEGLSSEQQETLRGQFAMETGYDPDDPDAQPDEFPLQVYQRSSEFGGIPNSIITDYFSASMQSNCEDCVISTYSMFDKYFNSWLSAEMVISAFGPVAYGEASKLLGWAGRRGWPWKLDQSEFMKAFRRTFQTPSSLFGTHRAQRMLARVQKNGFGDMWSKLVEEEGWTSGYRWFKGGSFRTWWDDLGKSGGYLDKIVDPQRRRELFNVVRDMREYSRTIRAIDSSAAAQYKQVLTKFGPGSAEEIAASVKYGQTFSKIMTDFDDHFALDALEWWVRDESAGLYTYAVRNKTGNHVLLTYDSQNLRGITNEFQKSGNWDTFVSRLDKEAYDVALDPATGKLGIQLYEPKLQGEVLNIGAENLRKNISSYKNYTAVLDNGEHMVINTASIDHILHEVTGNVRVFKQSGWEKAQILTPESFSRKLRNTRSHSNVVDLSNYNTDRMYDTLLERNFAGRRYTSLLDKAFAEQDQLIRSYFSIKGGAKWTLYPYLYWGAKQGFGQEDFAMYQLPDTWRSIKFNLGQGPLYSDGFIDFFANHGSDQGDIFVQVLNKLPWKSLIYDRAFEYFKVKDTIDMFTGGLLRTKVDNLLFYSTTPEQCDGCSINVTGNAETGNFAAGFKTRNKFDAYILEDTYSEDGKKKGSTLISYTRHLDLSGDTVEKGNVIEGGNINLANAQRDEKTCRDAVKKAFFGWELEKPSRIGGALALTESLSYVIFGWQGIFASLVGQMYFASQLQDCVDDAEGYYTHIFLPKAEDEPEANTSITATFDNIGQKTKEWTSGFMDAVGASPGSLPSGVLEDTKEQLDQLVNSATEVRIVESIVTMQNDTSGTLNGKMTYLWFKGVMQPSEYNTTALPYTASDLSTGDDVELNMQDGTITRTDAEGNKTELVGNEDIVRKTTVNTEIPAIEIPQDETHITIPGDKSLMFEMTLDSSLLVRNERVLDCIRDGVLEQTNTTMATNDMTEVFGKTVSVATTTHSKIYANKAKNQIIAEGAPRLIADGSNARVEINGMAEVFVKNDIEEGAGILKSVQFKNGFILYKPQTQELLVWLRHSEKAVLEQNDVSGLNAGLTTARNPLTECMEPAINLEALPIANSPYSAARVEQFNNSLEKMGSFQIFDTDTKRFVFYSKLENGECVDYFKVIDKATGEVLLDAPIDNIRVTPDGIVIDTPDGRHTLAFDAENGIPTISYNDGPPETIRTAQGRNGSFYYDPDTGRWYPENAQLLPLLEAFKQNGMAVGADPNNPNVAKASGNLLNVNIGAGADSPFNLPSLPESAVLIAIFVGSLLGVLVISRSILERRIRLQ